MCGVPAYVWSLLVALFAVWAVAMAVVIVQQRRSPAATIAWLLVLALLPLVGWLITVSVRDAGVS
jgi:hypothetical protein